MQKKSQQWVELLVKYWDGTITSSEKEKLDQQRNHSPAKEFQFQRIRRFDWNLARLKEMHEFDVEAGWQDVLRRVAMRKRLALLKRRLYWTAAALLTGLMLYIAYNSMQEQVDAVSSRRDVPATRPAQQEQPLSSNIFPPRNNAKLILYDGSEYLLNETKDGIIKKTAVLQIRKKGQAIYVTGSTAGSSSNDRNELILPEGSTCRLYLPDNTQVYMNASSSIVFPTGFTNTRRKVDIKGEAFLQVAPNEQTPFIVNLNNKYDVKAVGTNFLVRSYPDERQTTVKLANGELQITRTGRQGTIKYVRPKQQFIADDKTDSIVECEKPDADLIAWRESSFNLAKDLESIFQDVSKWYKVEVAYNTAVNHIRLSGQLPRDRPLSETLNHLQAVTKLRIGFSGNKIIVDQ